MSYPLLYSQYGSLVLTDSSPVQSWTEPITLLDVKGFGVIGDSGGGDQDALIETLFIPAAREQAEILQGRDLVQKQYDLSLDYWPAHCIELRSPLVSVDLVQRRDSDGTYTTLANTDYAVDTARQPGILLPAYGQTWPSFTAWPVAAILIRFTSGFSPTSAWWQDAGARIKVGMHLLISAWLNNRLPFVQGQPVQEWPFGARECMSYGRLETVR